MKSNFPVACARMASQVLRVSAVLGCVLISLAAQAADELYINTETVTDPPQIDATSFVNYGTFSFVTVDPFETSDTLYYTNYGNLFAGPGWIFDYAPPVSGVRQMADTFANLNPGVVESFDLPAGSFVGIPSVSQSLPSYLWVHATNILNEGLLSVGANGWLKLAGTNIDVSRSGLEVQDISQSAVGSFNFGTNFFPDVGIYDRWWGQTNLDFGTANIWNGQRATAPASPVQTINGGGRAGFSIPFPVADGFSNSFGVLISVTNIVGIPNPGPQLTNIDQTNILITDLYFPTNMYKQAAFVGVSDPSVLGVGVHYLPSTLATNPFKTIAVEIAFFSTNVITDTLQPTTLFFYDTLASETNRGVNQNVSTLVTYRPANYNLSRVDDGTYAFGGPGNIVPDSGYLFDSTFSNNVVSGEYAAYRAFVDDITAEPPPVAGATVTNLPGRVQIFAQNLDMSATRIRGGGQVIVDAKHLVSSAQANVDCQNLSYNLASTNGTLTITSLAKDTVDRLKGDVLAWSGLWSNTATIIYMNNYSISNILDTNGVTIGLSATQEPITNGVAINLHALLINGDSLITTLPVVTWDMIMKSTNVVLNDNLAVVEAFQVQGTSFTLNGNLSFSNAVLSTSIGTFLSSSISDWIYTNAPNLLYFTNNGSLTLPGSGHFGDDRPVPYTDFVNKGRINASAIYIDADYFQDSGTLVSQTLLNVQAGSGALLNGQATIVGNATYNCDQLKFSGYRLSSTSGTVNFNARNSLSDGGAATPNQVSVVNGFNLLVKPPMGDLLGTTFQTKTPDFLKVNHSWAANDLGASPSGYLNNVALGKLVMGPVGKGSALLAFRGTGAKNGLYVDLLDLSQLGTNYSQYIQIAPNLTIYYAAAKIAGTIPNGPSGIPQLPEEYLNGQFGGRVRWVSDFAGPNSSTPVMVGNQTVLMNTALRNSKIIDSDGDGVPNYYDSTPLGGTNPGPGGLSLTAFLASPGAGQPKGLAISFTAAPSSVYRVEVATDLAHPDWQLLTTYTNSGPASLKATVWDTSAPATSARRFYRVGQTQ
jgi:hypothetical protein